MQSGTHPWLLPWHAVPKLFSKWCSTSFMIFQVSKLPLFHCLFLDRGNPVNLTASQLPVILVYTAVFNDPLRSLCKKDSSHFWRVLALSTGQSAIPVVLDKATSTSIKALCQAIWRARIPATGTRATFLHHITPKTSMQVFRILYSPSSAQEGENQPYPLPATGHKGKKNTSFIIVAMLMRSD